MQKKSVVTAIITISTVLFCAGIGIADAATLFTPALFVNGVDNLECKIVNVGSAPITATITFYDGALGTAVGLPTTASVGPNRVQGKALFAPVFGDYFCKFTSTSINVRVSISRFQGEFGSDLNGYGSVK